MGGIESTVACRHRLLGAWGRLSALLVCAVSVTAVAGVVPGPAEEVARAEAASFVSLVPGRVLETRSGFATADGQSNAIGIRQAGSETALRMTGRAGVAADAKAVVLNVAVTGSSAAGFVTMWPCGQARPNASSLNYDAGQTISNAVTAQIGANGEICIFTFSATHVIVDVTGFYPSTAGFLGLVPGRVLETRPGMQTADGAFAGIGVRGAGTTTELPVRNRAGAGSAEAVVLNVAVTESTAAGFVTVWPCGEARPNASSLNYDAGQTISNAVTAKVGGNGAICIFVLSATHVIIDLTGSFPPGAGYVPLVPGRVMETRAGFSTVDNQANNMGIRPAGTDTELLVGGRAGVGAVDAVVLNLAVTGATGAGFVTIYPCGSPRPNASSLNFASGQTISNAVTAKVGTGGKICIFVFATTHVIIDVTGYFPGTIVGDPTSTTTTTTTPGTNCPAVPAQAGTEKFQAVYLRALDSADVASAPAQIRADVASANSKFFDAQACNRHPDFVMAGGTISVLSLTFPAAKAAVALTEGDAMAVAIRAQVAPNYPVIFYEGSTMGDFCGVQASPGYVLIPYDNCPEISRTQGAQLGFPFGQTFVIAHELTHALGAVEDCAPHSTKEGHVNDSNKDIVYFGPQAQDFSDVRLDFNRDDYYNHGRAGCPDIKDSPLFSKPA